MGDAEPVCIDDQIPFELPDGWVWARISSLFIINPRNDVCDSTRVSFVPMKAIEPNCSNIIHPEVRTWGDVKAGFTHFADGDIVFSKISPCFENGKAFIAKNLTNRIGAGSTELFVLRNKGITHLNADYVYAFLRSSDFIHGATSTFLGTVGQQRVKREYLECALIPIPPLNEQAAIAGVLMQYFIEVEAI